MSSENKVSVETRTSGRVKWFNNNSGYGFITATDGDKSGDDVFVHHSALKTDEQQYKYLVLGEYVEFDWAEVTDKESHKWQASNITGINGGKLMCETIKEQRVNNEGGVRRHRSRGNSRFQGYNNSNTIKDHNGKEWMLVPKANDE
mgnify:CR=1 FL=1|tara:strand:- start:565 stop:1002 length:438 start_codon:yes stop_codon:yes gene_type:complete